MTIETNPVFLCQKALARRWSISVKTLERWRWKGLGPVFVRIGGRVRYEIAEIEKYELRQRRSSTSDVG